MSWIQKGAFRLDLVPTNCIPYGSILIEHNLGQTYLRAVQPIFDESWTNFVQTNLFNLHNHVSRLVFEGQVFLLSYAKYCNNIKLLKKEETYVQEIIFRRHKVFMKNSSNLTWNMKKNLRNNRSKFNFINTLSVV